MLRKGVSSGNGVWADLGSGTGAFTLALAELLGAEGQIFSVDKDSWALREQARIMSSRFPAVTIHYQTADFTRSLDLPLLDGIVMANSLHYIPPAKKVGVVQSIRKYLNIKGRFILVEYNVKSGNFWVPHPIPFTTWQQVAGEAGFTHTELLATRPSSFLVEFYAALSW